jgi:preprotein translocase subunit YajC
MPFGDAIFLLAQAAAPAAEAPGQQPSLLSTLLPFLPIIPLYYFLILRPQQAQERKRKESLNAIKKNDRVLTQAGIFGTVVSVAAEGDKVVLRVSDDPGVKMEFSKASIVRVENASTGDKDKGGDKA